MLLLALAAPAGAQQTFFGEDLGLGESSALISWPNADAAHTQFMQSLAGVGTETFESFTAGATAPLTVDFGDAGTATLQGSGVIAEVIGGGTNGFGRYPISGTKFWETSTDFTIEFAQPQAAIGFYATDVGDFAGQLTLTYSNGTSQDVTIPNTASAPGGSVLFFGLIDTAHPFVSVTFTNSNASDSFGFDDMTFATSTQVGPIVRPPDVPALNEWGLAALAFALAAAAFVAFRRA